MRTSLALTLLAIIWLFSANTFGQESPRQPPNEPRPRSEQPPQQPPNRGPQPAPQPTPQPNPEDTSEANELALQQIISQQGLLPLVASNYNIPDVESDIAQLGKQLFFYQEFGRRAKRCMCELSSPNARWW